MTLLLLLACGSDDVAWAMDTMSVVPTSSGLVGTHTWHFFSSRWGEVKDDGAFVCARAQSFTGTVTSPAQYEGCAGCTVSYRLSYDELGSDCPADLAEDPAYSVPTDLAIGDVPDELTALDPQPDRSMGWYAVLEGVVLEPYGFAWDDAIDWGGDPGPRGWNQGQTYTLWPAYAWDLAGAGS